MPSGSWLRRTRNLRDLVLFGVIVTSPAAPMSIYGIISDHAHRHVLNILLIAIFAVPLAGNRLN